MTLPWLNYIYSSLSFGSEQQGAVMSNRLAGRGRDRYDYNEWGELTERRGP
jgi:hypothetical protein